MNLDRRSVLALPVGLLAMNRVAAAAPDTEAPVPIVFVHGNEGNASLWQSVVWRFESNGYPADRLFAFSFTNPTARDNDTVAQPNRSSVADQLRELTEQIERVRVATNAPKVALVANSRGGYAVRNFLMQEGAVAKVSHVVLCGVPNHGVFSFPDTRLNNEFNGGGPFLSRLNEQPGEITAGPAWLTIRSDGMDKFAQPDGRFIGQPNVPTGVDTNGPALKGAINLVLGAIDHRETAFHPRAFREIFKFIAGREPARIAVVPQSPLLIGGIVAEFPGGVATNKPLADAHVQVFALSPEGERQGAALYDRRTDATGAWGPATAPPGVPLEFVVAANNYPVTHLYRAPFARSTTLMNLRPGRPLKPEERSGALVLLTRPRGYFGLPRDTVILDGREPADVKRGVPTDSSATLRFADAPDRPIVCLFDEERVVCRAWPAADNHMTIAELTD